MYPELSKFQSFEKITNLYVVNLGTGMGYYDFVYEGIYDKAFNLSLPQQNLEFDYWMLINNQHKLVENAHVILVLPYFIFSAHWFDELYYVYSRYYALLPQEIVAEHSLMTYEEYRKLNVDLDESDKLELVNRLNGEEMYRQSCYAIEEWEKKLKLHSCMSGKITEHVNEQINITKKWFLKLLEFCIDKTWKPVVVVPPMSQVLLDMISSEFRQTHFYNPLQEVIANKAVKILDYSEDEYFCNPQHYGWPGFLVEEAAKVFTKDVLHKLGIKY